jgi:FtsP/CotA-like multicopper oxidase with cupredoxin domain
MPMLIGRLSVSLVAVALLLSACAPSTAQQPQPTMDPNMPGMDHSQMGQPAQASSGPAQAQATIDPAMPGMDGGQMAGHTMDPVDVSGAPAAAPDARGAQPLEPVLVDGVKEFQLTTSITRWNILPGVEVGGYAYNGQIPGPTIRVTTDDRMRVKLTNNLSEPTTIHWHGLVLPNSQDGAADVTQPPIPPGASFTYEFDVPDTPGTYFYHTHVAGDRQQSLGLYGALLIDDIAAEPIADQEYTLQLGEWRVTDGQTFPAMELEGMFPNYFTINGKSYPATDTINARVGDRILLRFIGSGQFIHPMHVHGGPFEIVGTDGNPVPEGARLKKDTVLVGPGERYDVVWTALEPGSWLIHCHIGHHITNDGIEVDGGGGLTMVINVVE